MREALLVDNDADFIVMDTSPGIRYWSINSIVISDIVLLTLKMGDLDLKGTIKMINEIYGSLIEHGSICSLLLNRVSGYCVPSFRDRDSSYGKFDLTEESLFKKKIQDALNNLLTESFNIDILAEIPCYCDIQFKEREYLTTNEFQNHPFTKKVYDLVESVEKLA